MEILKYLLAIYIIQDMSTRFFVGLGLGIFLSNHYNLKPYVDMAENKVMELHKELTTSSNLANSNPAGSNPAAVDDYLASWFKKFK